MALPGPVTDFLFDLVGRGQNPAFILTDPMGAVIDWGGDLSAYGIGGLGRGRAVGGQVPFLDGLIRAEDTDLSLPGVETESGRRADVHIFSSDEGVWTLLLDSTTSVLEMGALQQIYNEWSLLQHKASGWLNRSDLTDGELEFSQEILGLSELIEKKEVAVVQAKLRDLTSFCEKGTAIAATLGQYLGAVVRVVSQRGGTVCHAFGGAVMAIFGLIPLAMSPSRQATDGAVEIVRTVSQLSRVRQGKNEPPFDVSVGVASGLAVVGIIDLGDRKIFSAMGTPVTVAGRLAELADRGSVVIDEDTYQAVKDSHSGFTLTTLGVRDADCDFNAFSWEAE